MEPLSPQTPVLASKPAASKRLLISLIILAAAVILGVVLYKKHVATVALPPKEFTPQQQQEILNSFSAADHPEMSDADQTKIMTEFSKKSTTQKNSDGLTVDQMNAFLNQ